MEGGCILPVPSTGRSEVSGRHEPVLAVACDLGAWVRAAPRGLQLPGDFPGAAPLAPCCGGDPGAARAVPSAFIKAMSVTRGGDGVLVVSDTQQPPAEPSPACSPAHLPAVPATLGSPEPGTHKHVSPRVPLPPSCHRHNVPNSAWLWTAPLLVALPQPHNSHPWFDQSQLGPLSSQRPADTGNISAPFWGLCAHTGLYLVIFP